MTRFGGNTRGRELASVGFADQLVLYPAQLQDVTHRAAPGQMRGDSADRRARRPGGEETKLDLLGLVAAGLQDLGVQPGHGGLADLVQQPLDTGVVWVGADLAGPHRAVVQQVLLDLAGDGGRAVHRGFRAELAAPHDVVGAELPGPVHQVVHVLGPDADGQDEGVRGPAAGLLDQVGARAARARGNPPWGTSGPRSPGRTAASTTR